MNTPLPVYPFDPDLYTGTITEVGPSAVKANLPHAAAADALWHHGHRQGRGEVGDFVIIEVEDTAVFGRIINVRLPERERLTVEPGLGKQPESHPVGTIQLLSTITLSNGCVTGGLVQYPRLGSRVYAIHPSLLQWISEASHRNRGNKPSLVINLGSIHAAESAVVQISPERIFGRHCAVLGTTGGGKSWTVARLVEQAAGCPGAKLVLLDATGEFRTLTTHTQHTHLGTGDALPSSSKAVTFPYVRLTETDLFALFRPSGQTQVPKLRQAMKSLKLIQLAPTLASSRGLFKKALCPKAPFNQAYRENAHQMDRPFAEFDVAKLSQQVSEECVYPSGGTGQNPDYTVWGNYNEQERGYCVSLISRLEDMCSSPELECILQPQDKRSLVEEIDGFVKDQQSRVLRISLKHLAFTHNAREIVANAIGRHLLGLAREGFFRDRPMVVVLDEAHQFLDKALGDETNRYPLDAFELIAKEGRKYALSICIATQRPRDIPEGVLSQMGTLIVHRLINDRDREVVERASGEIDRSAAEFLPTLVPGQAIIIGVDFPIPLTIDIARPEAHPDSEGPDYQQYWSEPGEEVAQSAG
jgi:uncharacterized protein